MATDETSENLSIEAAKSAALSATDDEPLALLTVRDTVLFPHAVMPLNVGRPSSVALIESLGEARRCRGPARPSLDDRADDLYRVGALILKSFACRIRLC
jgi:ATP-dependent Lon protease